MSYMIAASSLDIKEVTTILAPDGPLPEWFGFAVMFALNLQQDYQGVQPLLF